MINKNNFFELSKNGKKRYFCQAEELDRECSACHKLIKEPLGVFCYSIFNNKREFGIYHLSCKDKIPKKANYQETGLLTFCVERIIGSIPVFFGAKTVIPANNNVSVFDPNSIPSDKVVDKTVFAGRDSLEGATIGVPLLTSEESEEFEEFFYQLQKSNPVITARLEDKRK